MLCLLGDNVHANIHTIFSVHQAELLRGMWMTLSPYCQQSRSNANSTGQSVSDEFMIPQIHFSMTSVPSFIPFLCAQESRMYYYYRLIPDIRNEGFFLFSFVSFFSIPLEFRTLGRQWLKNARNSSSTQLGMCPSWGSWQECEDCQIRPNL